MASLSVCELIFQAVNSSSVDSLREILYKYGLLSVMKNIGICNEDGETPLLLAIRLKHFGLRDFLVDLLKESIRDEDCPQCLFSIIHQLSEKLPRTEVIGYLVKTTDNLFWLEVVLKSIMSSSITRSEKIIVLEMMGAAFIFNDSIPDEEMAHLRGLHCWKEAMVLRYSPTCNEQTIPVIPLDPTELHWKAFGHVNEVLTLEQLEDLKKQSLLNVLHKNWQLLRESLRVQALLICQRIVQQLDTHKVAGPNLFHLKILLNYLLGDFLIRKRYCRSINISLIILEESKKRSTSPGECALIFASALNIMASCFMMMKMEPLNSFGRQELSSANLLEALKFGTNVASVIAQASQVKSSNSNSWYCCQLNVRREMFHFVSWLFELFPELNNQEKQQLKDHLSRYIKLKVQVDTKSNLLHLAIENFIVCDDFARKMKIIEYFLRVGEDPNAANINGKTPLHLLAEQWINWKGFRDYKKISGFYFSVLQMLVDAGGHLDQPSSDGQTVLCILKKQLAQMPGYHPELESAIDTILPLSCYCAQAILKYNIPFENRLPSSLSSFVLRHSLVKGKNAQKCW
jgi:hypothetical protein